MIRSYPHNHQELKELDLDTTELMGILYALLQLWALMTFIISNTAGTVARDVSIPRVLLIVCFILVLAGYNRYLPEEGRAPLATVLLFWINLSGVPILAGLFWFRKATGMMRRLLGNRRKGMALMGCAILLTAGLISLSVFLSI